MVSSWKPTRRCADMYTKPPVSTAAGTVLDGQEILIPKTPPAVLGLDGRKAYRDLRADYGYLYSPADLPALTSYCSAFDLVAQATRAMQADGAVIDRDGELVTSQWMKVWKDATSVIASLSTKIGIAASTRKESGSKGAHADHRRRVDAAKSQGKAVNGSGIKGAPRLRVA